MASVMDSKLHRYGPSLYYVICDKGHRFGLVGSTPSYGLECCYKAMLSALAEAYERMLGTAVVK